MLAGAVQLLALASHHVPWHVQGRSVTQWKFLISMVEASAKSAVLQRVN